jgi:hypothetical protein
MKRQLNMLVVGIALAGIGSSVQATVTNQMFIPLDPARGSVFYRLIYP